MGHPFPQRFNCLQKEGRFPSLPWQLICFSALTIAHLTFIHWGNLSLIPHSSVGRRRTLQLPEVQEG